MYRGATQRIDVHSISVLWYTARMGKQFNTLGKSRGNHLVVKVGLIQHPHPPWVGRHCCTQTINRNSLNILSHQKNTNHFMLSFAGVIYISCRLILKIASLYFPKQLNNGLLQLVMDYC